MFNGVSGIIGGENIRQISGFQIRKKRRCTWQQFSVTPDYAVHINDESANGVKRLHLQGARTLSRAVRIDVCFVHFVRV